MLETPHVVVGAAIATKVGNPALAIPLAFASHFVLDMVPHWNPHTYTETMKLGRPSNQTLAITITDLLVSAGTGIYLASAQLPNTYMTILILACCFASVLPDVSKYPFFLFKRARKGFYKKWVDYERSLQANAAFFWGVTTQVLTILAGLWWFFG